MPVSPEAFKDAFARWPAGVALVAVRDDGRLYATTVSSLVSVSAEPPRLVLSLGPGAQVLPFLREGTSFGVSVLSEAQQRLATVFADSFPVGPSPFGADDPPRVPDALAALVCRVTALHDARPARLVMAEVEEVALGGDGPALVHWRRSWHGVG